MILYLAGVLPDHWFTRFSFQLATAVEMLIFAFAVGDQVRRIERERGESLRCGSEADHLRSVLGAAYHDLAGPLSVIQMEAAMASPEGAETWSRVQKAASLQGQILGFLKKERGRLDPVSQESSTARTSAQKIFSDLEFLYGEKATKKGVALFFEIPPDLADLPIPGDPVILSHSILGNLIQNAIKFTPAGNQVKVSLQLVDGRALRILVQDEGEGISKLKIALLEAGISGGRVHSTGTQSEAGTGVGLSVARYFTGRLGGKLSIVSRPVVSGTRITVELPRVAT